MLVLLSEYNYFKEEILFLSEIVVMLTRGLAQLRVLQVDLEEPDKFSTWFSFSFSKRLLNFQLSVHFSAIRNAFS